MTAARDSRLAALAFVAVAAAVFAQDLVIFTGPDWGEDVAQHWVAAKIHAGGGDPYAAGALRLGGEQFGLIRPGQPTHHFLEQHHYPPLGLILGYPISLVAYPTARILWMAVSILATFVCLPLLIKFSGIRWDSPAGLVMVGAFLLCLPVRGALGLGQPDVFLFVLLLAGLWLDGEDRPWLAGGPLALAALLKLIPFLWILYFVSRRRWRTTFSTVTWAAGLTVASLTLVPARIYLSFLDSQLLFVSAGEGWQRYEPTNLSLSAWLFKGFAFLSGGRGLEWAAAVAGRVLSAAILGAIIWRLATTQANSPRAKAAGMGLLCCGIALISPLTWQHHLVVLGLPLAVVLAAVWERADARRFISVFLVPYLLVALLDPRLPALRLLTADLPKGWRDASWSLLPLLATTGIVWLAAVTWQLTGEKEHGGAGPTRRSTPKSEAHAEDTRTVPGLAR